MNYIQQIKDKLRQELQVCDDDLLDFYALLLLVKGTDCTDKDVHDAWAVWKNRTDPEHKSLVPFEELSPEVQALDTYYTSVIRDLSET